MSSPCRLLLSALAAGMLLCSWGPAEAHRSAPRRPAPRHPAPRHPPAELSSLPPVADPGPCTPPRDASAHVGQRGYGRFHANDSWIGRPLPCTQEDKICFGRNLLFDPKQGICDYIGGGHDYNCDLRPHRSDFEKGSGRLVGVCKIYEDPCPGYRMAFDGRCYKKEIVRDVLCGCEAKPTRHFLEGVECRSSPATPISIQQPMEPGLCLIPDLRFPDIERSEYFENPFTPSQGFQGTRTGISTKEATPRLKCDPQQAACFSQEKVLVSGEVGCFRLLERGPCPEEHVVAMDIHAAVQGRAEATCVHVRGGCPPGHRRLVFDGECHEDKRVAIEAPGKVTWNQYGHHVFIPRGFSIWFHPRKVHDFCEVHNSAVGPGVGEARPKPPCGANDKGHCDLYEVQSDPPKPEF